jgi:hypothetical protein
MENFNDWNFDNDDFGFDDEDEIAKIYAQQDMESQNKEWAREQALKFYDDFEHLNINEAVLQINCLIADKTLTRKVINDMLDNMITIFVEMEEYEKCDVCNKIKIKFNDRI